MNSTRGSERFETVVIGGGQAGLSVGYHLAKRDRQFVILDAGERIGDSWRQRWDSLRLFTPASRNGLPGMPFPAKAWSFPTRAEMADYLEAYGSRFDLPVRRGVRVDMLSRREDRYVVASGDRRYEADHVVVAAGAYQNPRVPAFASELDPSILQLHSSEYRHPSQLREGGVLLVGAGNSGAEIALEASRSHRTWLSGRDTGHLPFRTDSRRARLLIPLLWFVGSHVLTVRTPIGRRMRPKVLSSGAPLIRLKPKDLAAAGVERLPRMVGVRDGSPALEDGRVLEVSTVIWCTGFRPDYGWIDLPVFGRDGEPVHQRGVVAGEPGLYFVGLSFLHAFTSENVGGVGRDAGHIARYIVSRDRARAGGRSRRTHRQARRHAEELSVEVGVDP